MEDKVEALLATADEDTSVNFQPCKVPKKKNTILEIRKGLSF
jgi:hypothetical protein